LNELRSLIQEEENMFNIRLADVVFSIDNKYSYVEKMCTDYICDDIGQVDICVTDEEINAEKTEADSDRGYLESLAVYRKIAEKIIDYKGFLMHGAVVEADGTGVAFLAKSGVGKSTHMMLWEKCLGTKFKVINGDKPLIRLIDGKIYAYGTPWAGKEKLQTNARTELEKICFLERAEENSCMPLSVKNVLEKFFPQIYRPSDGAKIIATLEMAEQVINNAEFYTIRCNMDISAAQTAIGVVLDNSIEKQLEKNGMCITETSGNSMYPMLSTGTKVMISVVDRPLKKIDVPVYRRGDHYTMHRIVKVTDSGYVICGDNRTDMEYDVTDSDIIGVLAGFYKDGNFIDAQSDEFVSYGKRATRSYWLRRIKNKLKSVLKTKKL